MTYIELIFSIKPTGELPLQIGQEILIAELGELPFDTMQVIEGGLKAYIPEENFTTNLLKLHMMQSHDFTLSHVKNIIAPQNWNAKWESQFAPIFIDNQCVVRAPFHPVQNLPYEIVIEPKMSFGTGHHETTHMMLSFLLETDVATASLLDMGCGTAVLALLAAMRGATPVTGIDIDERVYENALENVTRNGYPEMEILLGGSLLLKERKFDIILANINRNILINDFPVYVAALNNGGTLLVSGFYQEDVLLIQETAAKNGLVFTTQKHRNNWAAICFRKPNI